MLHTTLRLARQEGACKPSYRKFAASVGGVDNYGEDTPIPLSQVLEVLGLRDALWCLWAVLPEEEAARDRLARLLACAFAEHVAPFWVAPIGIDWQPGDTISVARRYALGQATKEELASARAEALAAWHSARVARGTIQVASASAWTAEADAIDAAIFAAGDAEGAAYVAAEASGEAAFSAFGAAGYAAMAAERQWQHEQFAAMLAA